MLRKIGIALICLIILVSGSFSIYYTYEVKETMSAMLGEARLSVEEKNVPKAKELSEQIHQYWKEHEQNLIIFVHRQEVDSLTDVVAQFNSLIEYEDLSMFSSQVDQALNIIENIWSSQLPVLQNIL